MRGLRSSLPCLILCLQTHVLPRPCLILCLQTHVLPQPCLILCLQTHLLPRPCLILCLQTHVLPRPCLILCLQTHVLPRPCLIVCLQTFVLPRCLLLCLQILVLPRPCSIVLSLVTPRSLVLQCPLSSVEPSGSCNLNRGGACTQGALTPCSSITNCRLGITDAFVVNVAIYQPAIASALEARYHWCHRCQCSHIPASHSFCTGNLFVFVNHSTFVCHASNLINHILWVSLG